MLLAALLAAATPAPALVTLDVLRALPAGHRGRVVRVAGQVDQCWNMSCRLCPLESTRARPQWERCLQIGFDRMRGGRDEVGADMDSAFRYADVRVEARFDPTCLQSPCLDRGSVLQDARVLSVSRRRASREGLIERRDPLLEAPAEAARAVASLVRGEAGTIRVFASRSDPRIETHALVCRARSRSSDGLAWPDSWEGALFSPSTEDRYRCWRAVKGAGGWILDPA